MAAQVENGRQSPGGPFRHVKISRDIEARQTLKNHLLYAERVPFQSAGDLRLQRAALWKRIEAKHLEQLTAQLASFLLPDFQASDVVQAARGHFGGKAFQLIRGHFVTLR